MSFVRGKYVRPAGAILIAYFVALTAVVHGLHTCSAPVAVSVPGAPDLPVACFGRSEAPGAHWHVCWRETDLRFWLRNSCECPLLPRSVHRRTPPSDKESLGARKTGCSDGPCIACLYVNVSKIDGSIGTTTTLCPVCPSVTAPVCEQASRSVLDLATVNSRAPPSVPL